MAIATPPEGDHTSDVKAKPAKAKEADKEVGAAVVAAGTTLCSNRLKANFDYFSNYLAKPAASLTREAAQSFRVQKKGGLGMKLTKQKTMNSIPVPGMHF